MEELEDDGPLHRLAFMRKIILRFPQSLDKIELLRQIGWIELDLKDYPPLPKESAAWGASHVTHPAYIAEQREKNQRARDILDGMTPKEPTPRWWSEGAVKDEGEEPA